MKTKEVLDLLTPGSEVERGNPDTLVVFFRETPTQPRWIVSGVTLMRGWMNLGLFEKTSTYISPLSKYLENLKKRSGSTKLGYVNFKEAVGIWDGSLKTELAEAMRSAELQVETVHVVDFLPGGEIRTKEQPLSLH